MKLNNLVSQQRHRRITKPMREKQFRRISASQPFEAVQLDLAFLPKLRSPLNNNMWGFIVVIDVFSRYLWIKTFTNRKSLHIPIESVLKQMKSQFGRTPNTMTADNEFATLANQQLAANYDFKWYFADANEKYRTGISERVIGIVVHMSINMLRFQGDWAILDEIPKAMDQVKGFLLGVRDKPWFEYLKGWDIVTSNSDSAL